MTKPMGSKARNKLYSLTTEQSPRHRKRIRKKLSTPKQVRQDEKHAKEYAVQLVNANFGKGDLLIDLTYEEEPPDREQAERDVLNFVNRVKTLYKKAGLPFKAFWVTGGGNPKENGEGVTRFHHHLIIKSGVPREAIEDKWKNGRVKSSRAKILRDEFGLEPRANYMVKPGHRSKEKNAKRWHSCGLKKPIETINDNRYDGADMSRIAKAVRAERLEGFISRNYKGWEFVGNIDDVLSINPVTNLEEITIKLRKKE